MAIRDASRALREGRHTSRKTGTVVEIGRSYDDKSLVRVEIELPAKRPKKKKRTAHATDMPEESYKPRDHITVGREFAKGLSIGDRVTIETHISRG